MSNQEKHCTFLPPVQHNSRPLRSVDQFKIITGYISIIRATFVVGFKFQTLLDFETFGEQNSGNWKNVHQTKYIKAEIVLK